MRKQFFFMLSMYLLRMPKVWPGKMLGRRMMKRTIYLLLLPLAVVLLSFLYLASSNSLNNGVRAANKLVDSSGNPATSLELQKMEPLSPTSFELKPLSQKCSKPHCSEFLSKKDKVRQRACLREVLKHQPHLKMTVPEHNCDFMDGQGRAPVALASAEGSGNTWLRGLLEQVTGKCTGFNFCDYVMRMKGFIGDNINSGSVLVVKTHSVRPQWIGERGHLPPVSKYEAYYGSAVFLLRNPYHALIAEWNRRLTNKVMIKQHLPHNESHVNVVPKEIWYSNNWDNFLHTYLELWEQRIRNWVLKKSAHHPVLVVKYEDLKRDSKREMLQILNFLQLPFEEEEVSLRLGKDFTTFKRPNLKQSHFEHYTGAQNTFMESVILRSIEAARKSNSTLALDLLDYLNED